ncbi:MAG: hypothetical protein ACI915_003522 [Gammaproteobacteria bacterium]|jgi:hypothetical protein
MRYLYCSVASVGLLGEDDNGSTAAGRFLCHYLSVLSQGREAHRVRGREHRPIGLWGELKQRTCCASTQYFKRAVVFATRRCGSLIWNKQTALAAP